MVLEIDYFLKEHIGFPMEEEKRFLKNIFNNVLLEVLIFYFRDCKLQQLGLWTVI